MRMPAAARTPAAAALLALALAPGARARAQQTVVVIPPAGGDTLASVTPLFTIQATGTGPGPLRFRFELDDAGTFARPQLDTLITTRDSTITVRPTRALTGGSRVYWRATVTNPAGFASATTGGPRTVPAWVRPLEPRSGSGAVISDRRPRFVWSRPQVGEPPGPWVYDVSITNNNNLFISSTTPDTVYQLPEGRELETNATYIWTVTARLLATAQSQSFTPGQFIVLDSVVTATLLYQNFPNPFPSPTRAATCVWVDIAQATRPTLEVYSLRGVRVRRLLPRPELSELAPGRYGRALAGSGAGCDPRFEWDGTDDRGDRVPAGVYLLRFRAGDVGSVKKILYRGG
jgi:hypothetical protein